MNPEEQFKQACSKLESDDTAGAFQQLSELYHEGHRFQNLCCTIGICLLQMKCIEDAQEMFKQELTLHLDNEKARTLYHDIFQPRFDPKAKSFLESTSVNIVNAISQALSFWDEQNFRAALAVLEPITALKVNIIGLFHLQALCFYRLGDLESAWEACLQEYNFNQGFEENIVLMKTINPDYQGY